MIHLGLKLISVETIAGSALRNQRSSRSTLELSFIIASIVSLSDMVQDLICYQDEAVMLPLYFKLYQNTQT